MPILQDQAGGTADDTGAPSRGDNLLPSKHGHSTTLRILLAIAVAEILNGSYLAAFDTPSIFYHANVLLHVVLGVPLALALLLMSVPALLKGARRSGGPQGLLLRILAVVALVFVGSGLILSWTGTARPYYALLRLHVASAIAGGIMLLALVWAWSRRPGADAKSRAVFRWNFGVLGAALALPLLMHGYRAVYPPHVSTIVNPPLPPLTAMDEGGGPHNPFFPSSNETVGARFVPPDFFLDSRGACGNRGCHPDITAQWEGSMHHFSSFNNQWYRKAVEYMQDTVGTRPSKWCGGCHDMAILLTGRMDTPIREQIGTPEAQAGIGCLACHAIVHVKDTMGQGGYVIEYPEMHRLASSKAPLIKTLHDYMTRLDPAPHRKTMLKPFHRESTPEFCSACHKVHLDVPVNSYRWLRGFDEYDAWQQSGVSGQGARSFYYPPEPRNCANCHMPLVASDDAGNIDGMVHSHRFPGANTALPYVNGDEKQLEATETFLKRNSVTVDIFGVIRIPDHASASPGGPPAPAPPGSEPDRTPVVATMFAGEEGVAGATGPGGSVTATGRLLAPLPDNGDGVTLERGRDYIMEVVVRTRGVGHMFPGGTVDAFDVWVELEGVDDAGRIVFWNGWTEPEQRDGRPASGPVDPEAHFYRSFLLDAHGNPINKRNAWAARALLYARMIPPGAADTVHFRVRLPDDCGPRVTFTAKVNHRKFAWWNTQWAYSGVRDPSQPAPAVSPGYDDGRWVFTGDTAGVSGPMKHVPDLPITELAQSVRSFPVSPRGKTPAVADPLPGALQRADTRERYNDYGIGLLLQKDLKGAAAAFRKVIEIDPGYPDGYVNLARAQIQEGSHREAAGNLEKALSIDPSLARSHYLYALTLKTVGRYDEAIDHLRRALGSYPRDRVVLNQLGRILFLQRRYDEAIAAFEQTLAVDPEDLQAHYNLMLCYRGKGDTGKAGIEETLYMRFKADESSQELTGPYRLAHAEDNNERLLVHEHRSTWRGPASVDPGYSGQ